MVTAETAAVLPVLALLLAAGLWAVSAAGVQLRCADAAREAARAAARGEPDAQVRSAGLSVAPAGALLTVDASGGQVHVVVTAHVHPLSRWLPVLTVSTDATARQEPAAP